MGDNILDGVGGRTPLSKLAKEDRGTVSRVLFEKNDVLGVRNHKPKDDT